MGSAVKWNELYARQTPSLGALAVAARDGDASAAEQLCDIARPRLTRIALAFGAPPDEVPDLVQEVLLAGWRNLGQFDRRKGTFIAWLVPGLRGRVHNQIRSRGRWNRALEKLKLLRNWQAGQKRMAQDAVEARLTVRKLLQVLTERQREVVALYEIEGLSARETGRVLGMSEAGVRSIARDARNRLRHEARCLE